MKIKFFRWSVVLKTVCAVLVVAAIVGYGEYRRYTLNNQLTLDNTNLQSKITAIQNILAQIQIQNASINNSVQTVQNTGQFFTEQAGQISSVENTLYKLSKVDPQLLQKYSKVYFLNENYVPTSLSYIDSAFLYDKNSKLQIQAQTAPFFENLLVAAKQAQLSLEVISAYRSFGTQSILKSSYKVTYGAGTANAFSADQGYSEHQLGTAVDFTTPSVGSTFDGFDQTPEYQWLTNNAYKYGFILSYPKNNPYYEYEPWHWRFVGVDLATRLHNEGKNFYDLDQNTINDYLSAMFD